MLQSIYSFDFSVFNSVFSIHNSVLDFFMKVITQLGDGGIIWIVFAVLFLLFKRTRKIGITMAAALIIMLVCNDLVLKNVFSRPRPFDYEPWLGIFNYPGIVPKPTSFSFPSGHTSSSFAGATAIFSQNKKLGIPALILAALIGFSRIYVGVHYCTDVIAGTILGVVYGLIGVAVAGLIIKLIKKKKDKKQIAKD